MHFPTRHAICTPPTGFPRFTPTLKPTAYPASYFDLKNRRGGRAVDLVREDGLDPLGEKGRSQPAARGRRSPSFWESVLRVELLALVLQPSWLGWMLLDDRSFLAPFAAFFDSRLGPVEASRRVRGRSF
jgi:hypothetical protein